MTVRTLVLLRHAKAANPERLADVDRPLTARGHADSAAVGAWLAAKGIRPGLVLCSPARRTRETWHGVRLALGGDAAAVQFDRSLYEAGVGATLDLIQQADNLVDVILVVGHNPTVSSVSLTLDPEDDTLSEGLRTAGLAVHRVDGGWTECRPGAAPRTASYTARAGG
jgi:phosphohistidine phosphatase